MAKVPSDLSPWQFGIVKKTYHAIRDLKQNLWPSTTIVAHLREI